MTERTQAPLLKIIAAVFAAMLCAVALSLAAPATSAHAQDETTIYIRSTNDLIAEALSSRTSDTSGITYILDLSGEDVGGPDGKTLDLTDSHVDSIVDQIGSLTFGTKDNPFKGTFDGNGYTIKGLDYHRSILASPDTGLFAWTKGAVIKNLNLTDAYVGADYRGGVVVGYAEDTRIENIKLTNCTSSVTPANNAVSLVTNAGLAGGMVAGEAWNSTFYNVEVQGGSVVNNSTAAVSGLGGEGLYLGSIVGIAKNSTIEYCRVTPIRNIEADGTATYTYTRVHNKYDIAIGAVSGQAIYSGGIAGSLYDGSEAIDCFSTADCYTYGGTYVSVGAGNVGYTGGIVARVDDYSLIERCHYAGNLHSKLYNALLVIPIIQYNIRLGGIVERDDDAQAVIKNSYYAPHFSAEPDTDKDIPAIYDRSGKKVYAGASFGSQDEETYRDRSFWEAEGFDFAGGTVRTSRALAGQPHVNKWVMDNELGIPVHGDSVKATFDFPGAGTAEIGPSDTLSPNASQMTSDAFEFAVQGFVYADTAMEFNAAVNPVSPETTPDVTDTANNQGFRFVGWYREPNVSVNDVDPSHSFFDPIVRDESKMVSSSPMYVAENTGPGNYDKFAGNDLFVAAMEAQVRYHDVVGNVVDHAGAPDATGEDDWYKFEDTLPDAAEPQSDRTNGVTESARFIGWTTVAGPDGGGWAAISAGDLTALVNGGNFYTAGDPVLKPMDLYPVYLDYISNIITVCEGNEQDDVDDLTQRIGVATTNAVANGDSYTIQMQGSDKGSLPYGYRFTGWYETDSEGNEWRVSTEPSYTLPADVDLTKPHTYTARFEYRIDAWLPLRIPGITGKGEYGYQEYFAQNNLELNGLFATVWMPYLAQGSDIKASLGTPSVRGRFHYWTDHVNVAAYPAYADDFTLSSDELDALKDSPDIPELADTEALVTSPMDIDAIVEYEGFYDVVSFTDFPGSYDTYAVSIDGLGRGNIDLDAQSGYRYKGIVRFSTKVGNRPDFGDGTTHMNSTDFRKEWNGRSIHWTDSSHLFDDNYQNVYFLKASADINFYDMEGAKIYTPDSPLDLSQHFYSPNDFPNDATATRKYQSMLFNAEGVATVPETALTSRETIAPSDRIEPVGLGSVPFDLNPVVEGGQADPVTGDASGRFIYRDGAYYGFLGWMCPQSLTSAEMSHAFVDAAPTLGAAGYVATSAANAVPYLLTPNTRVEHAMDIYPVYAKFDIATTTNVARAGVPEGSGINIPIDPAYAVSVADESGFTVCLEADITTKVGQGTEETYRLTSFTVERQDGSVEVLNPVAADPGNVFEYSVLPGESYLFVAYYEPLAVSYHTSETDVAVFVRNKGDNLGKAPEQAFQLDPIDAAAGSCVVFAGWTEQRPESGTYLIVEADQQPKLVKPTTIVERCMELFPVFRKVNVTVDSNIDDILAQNGTDAETVRSLQRTPEGLLALSAKAPAGYKFTGWYRDFTSNSDKGALVSEADTYVLPTTSLMKPGHYTAVFQEIHEVRYHDTHGNLIFTAYVDHDSGRSFITTQTDDQGQTAEALEDIEAWQAISQSLEAEGNQPDAALHELIYMWQWVDKNGSVVSWNDFCRKPIIGDMDLYPITRQVSSFDDQHVENTDALYWTLDPRSDVPVKAYFKQAYPNSSLTIHVDEAAYAPSADGSVTPTLSPVPDRNIGLHAAAIQGEPWVKATDAAGDAVFELNGSIILTKTTEDPHAAGMPFCFKVTETMSGTTRDVTVTLPAIPSPDGAYAASVAIDVPVGRFKVTEDASWAWRYDSYMLGPSTDSDAQTPSASIEFDVFGSPVEVSCTNSLAVTSWLDASANVKNEFAAQGGGA